MIKINNITKKYEEKIVLNTLDLEIEENSINIITGPSGCGKTTLFNIISGLDKSYSGIIDGVPEDISFLFQEDRLLPYYSVLDNVMFTLPDSMDESTKFELAEKYLSALELSKEHKSFPHELSGGMKRRVAIARSLAYPSSLLLMDEPFNGLNKELKSNVINAIYESISYKMKTVMIITHDLHPFKNIRNKNLIKL